MTNDTTGTKRTRWLLAILALPLAGAVALTTYAVFAAEEVGQATAQVAVTQRTTAAVRALTPRRRAVVEAAVPEVAPDAPGADARLAASLCAVRGAADAVPLRGVASGAADPRVRVAALEELARLGDYKPLLDAARDEKEHPKVRRHATRFLGRRGAPSLGDLETILASETSEGVRGGAVLGLGETGTAKAALRLVELAAGRSPALRDDALEAIARVASADSAVALHAVLAEPKNAADVRVAVCRGLARVGGRATTEALAAALGDAANPDEVRVAAANSLGRLADPAGAAALTAATYDSSPEIARQARLASSRIAR
jgi:HEAT repeat protein